MKKWLFVICILLLVVGLTLSIVGNLFIPSGEYDTYLVKYSQCVHLGDPDAGFETKHNVSDAPEHVTVDFKGESYEGKLLDPADSWRYPYAFDIYTFRDKSEGRSGAFTVIRGSERLWKFYITSDEQEDKKPAVSDPDATALEVATDFAKKHIKNLNRYEVSLKRGKVNGSVFKHEYTVTFMYKVNGYRTEDCLTVEVNNKGTLVGYCTHNLGAFVGRGVRVDDDLLNTSLDNCLQERYKAVSLSINTYDFAEQELVVLQDGRVGVYTKAHVSHSDSSSDHPEEVQLLTVIGKLPWSGWFYLGITLTCAGAAGILWMIIKKKRFSS